MNMMAVDRGVADDQGADSTQLSDDAATVSADATARSSPIVRRLLQVRSHSDGGRDSLPGSNDVPLMFLMFGCYWAAVGSASKGVKAQSAALNRNNLESNAPFSVHVRSH